MDGPKVGQNEDSIFNRSFNKFLGLKFDILDDHGHGFEQSKFFSFVGESFEDELGEELIREILISILKEEVFFESFDHGRILGEIDKQSGIKETILRVFGSFGEGVRLVESLLGIEAQLK